MWNTSHGWWMSGESIFWLLLIVGAIWLVVSLTRDTSVRAGGAPSALDILEQRYARGEIASDEFQKGRTELSDVRDRGGGKR